MPGPSLGLEIDAKSNVPQAMDKARAATANFEKQLQDINKKFSNSFKDIFLSFAAPVVLLNKGLDLVLKYWEDQKRVEQEATQQAIDGINKRMSQEDIYWARKRAAEQKDFEDSDKNKAQIEKRTREFIMEDKRGYDLLNEADKARIKGGGLGAMSDIGANKQYQEAVKKIITEDMRKTGMLPKPGEEQKATTYQGPQGINAVVGMGNNAAVQAQFDMLDESRKQTTLLQQIAGGSSYTAPDFTKPSVAAPSRSYLLTK